MANQVIYPELRTIAQNIDFVRDCAHKVLLGTFRLSEDFLTVYGYIEDNIPELFPVLQKVYQAASDVHHPEAVIRGQAWERMFDIDDECDRVAEELL